MSRSRKKNEPLDSQERGALRCAGRASLPGQASTGRQGHANGRGLARARDAGGLPVSGCHTGCHEKGVVGGNRPSERGPLASQRLGLPLRWRERIPHPADYYPGHVTKLGRASGEGWAQGLCPFHDDHDASLSVHLDSTRGLFRCCACDARGDVIAYHMRRTGLDFVAAVRDLVRRGA
jgi:hypothetical protein